MGVDWIELAGAHNVRALTGLPAGGRRTRQSVLLRGDRPDDLTEADAATLRDLVGLRAVVDLRTTAELSVDRVDLAVAGVQRMQMPLLDMAGTAEGVALRADLVADGAAAYRRMLAAARPRLPQILRFLVQTDRMPALIHCAAGKDRTGIVIAVLLSAAGVDREAIVADYMATDVRLDRVRRALGRTGGYRAYESGGPDPDLSRCHIEAVLDELDAADGGGAGYLRSLGGTPTELARWRELMLEPVP